MGDSALLIISLGIILLGAEGFTNAVEWLGERLNLGAGAVGSILAAVGTALPEALIPVMAFFGDGSKTDRAEVGIGAILGAPFMLVTLALFISGLAVLLFRQHNKPLLVDPQVLQRDLGFFLLVYTIAMLASFLPNHKYKIFVACLLLGFYCCYVMITIRANSLRHGYNNLPPLYLARRVQQPSLFLVIVQIAFALIAIIAGAHGFVQAVQSVAKDAGISVFVLSIIITPIATELPEKFNSVLWLRRKKDTLALGNITGAMVFQSSVIPALGMILTPWKLELLALWSVLLALGSASSFYLVLKRRGSILPTHLLLGGVFYLLFILSISWLNR
ncbi:MAG: sodium:calcium antiporter [Desulfitobacteriaceae bacterium]